MNADILILILALFFAAWGFLKGAFREIFSLLALAAAFFFSAPLTNAVLPVFKGDMGSYALAQSAGRVVMWFALYFLIILIGRFAESRFVKKAALRFANRIVGGAIGFLKAVILSIALMWCADVFISLTGAAAPAVLETSRMYAAAAKSNILMKTRQVAELKKMLAIAKIAQGSLSEMPEEMPGALMGMDAGQIEKALEGVDSAEIEKLLNKMSSTLPGLKLPPGMEIKKIQKLVSDMNRESVKKISRAAQ